MAATERIMAKASLVPWRHGLTAKILVPVLLILGAGGAAVALVTYRLQETGTVRQATLAARETVAQFKALRKYYVKNVIAKVVGKSNVKASFDHAGVPRTIPLPATVIHDMSERLRSRGTNLKLYSAYPFPNRADRKLDTFGKAAWDFLNAKPDATFSRRETRGEKTVLRVAIADKMVAKACVDCHNSHPQTPKTGWKLGDVRGVLEVDTDISEQLAMGQKAGLDVLLVVLGLGLVLAAVIYWLVRRIASRPLENAMHIAERVAAGELDAGLEEPGQSASENDEIGRLMRGFQGMQHELQERAVREERTAVEQKQVIDDCVRVLGAMAGGDLTQTIQADYDGAFGRLKDDANAAVERLNDMVERIRRCSGDLTGHARNISHGSSDVAERMERQAASLEETAASMNDMTSTIRQNADNARHANQLAVSARERAESGGALVRDAVEAMEGINDSSRRIAEIIRVIDDIAFQTNLLALNASVEAARAGEQGRGFAVVAAEVRTLASRSVGAAKEIKALIEESVGTVESGTELVNRSGNALGEIESEVKRLTDLVAEISAASSEQANGIEQVNQTVSQIDRLTQENSTRLQEASTASEAMEADAARLESLVGGFRTLPDAGGPGAERAGNEYAHQAA